MTIRNAERAREGAKVEAVEIWTAAGRANPVAPNLGGQGLDRLACKARMTGSIGIAAAGFKAPSSRGNTARAPAEISRRRRSPQNGVDMTNGRG
jgi:hypothetical protein